MPRPAPPLDVSRQLRLTAQAEADAWQQAADAATRHDHAQAASAKTLAGQLAAERQQLEAANTRYEQWSAATTSTREAAAKAGAELERRGLTRRTGRTTAASGLLTKPEVDNAADPSIEREHQVAVTMDEPRLPKQTTQPELTPQQRLRGCLRA